MSANVVQLHDRPRLACEQSNGGEIERYRRRIDEWLEANHYFDHHRSRLYALVHAYASDSRRDGDIHRLQAADELLREFDRVRTGMGGLS